MPTNISPDSHTFTMLRIRQTLTTPQRVISREPENDTTLNKPHSTNFDALF